MEANYCLDQYDHQSSDVVYVTNNIPGPGINLNDFESEFVDGCICVSDCQENCPCIKGHRNYISGIIFEKKHMIIECNNRCACDKTCENRVIQRGPLDCLFVEKTNKGLGLFSKNNIKKGQFICEYAGEIIGLEEANVRIEKNRVLNLMNYVLVVSEYVGEKKITTCIDPKKFGNIGRYANHSCEPNAILVPVRVENMIPRMSFFASQDIDKMNEITFDYAANVENNFKKFSNTKCLCGSKICLKYLPNC